MKKIFLIAMSMLLLNCDFALAQEKINKDISNQPAEVASTGGVENEKPKKKKSSKKGKKNKKAKTKNNN